MNTEEAFKPIVGKYDLATGKFIQATLEDPGWITEKWGEMTVTWMPLDLVVMRNKIKTGQVKV